MNVHHKQHAYQDRYVAFIDILGFKRHVDSSIHDRPLFNTLRSILSSDVLKVGNDDINIHQFSDSIIFTAKNNNNGLINIIESVISSCSYLLINNILTRGAITKGKLYDDSKVVFGPAFIRAYHLETETAVYPRILIDRCIYNDLKLISCHKKYCRQDFDTRIHLDILKLRPRFEAPGFGVLIGYGRRLRISEDEWLHDMKKFIEQELAKKKSDGHNQKKYIWMAMYFNSFLRSSKNQNIKKIKLNDLRIFLD